ncbi:MAG: hypothetical protein ACPG8F_06135 [Flavobacteriaceae bacterium]
MQPNKVLYLVLLWIVPITAYAQFTGTNRVINNGQMRFGNGTQLSINAAGNVEQPFYYSTNFSAWRKLTYTEPTLVNYPLDSKIGVGGDGSNNWNTNGTLVTNPTMANQVFDSSSFSTVGGLSYGTLVVKGEITVGTARLELTNAYTLNENRNFVQVITTITNIGIARANNIRYWVGTRDDYVGGTDQPTKVRGNLNEGAFEPLTLTTQRAAALRITTIDEGILFFTTSSRGNNAHSNYDPVNNPSTNINPDTSPITSTNDGSYSMFIRINDLNPSESDAFVWYYAAAALSELDDVIDEVADSSRDTDWDMDGILNQMDDCPYTRGVSSLNGCPWPIDLANNYSSTTVSNSVVVGEETYFCQLFENRFFNTAYHSGENPEPEVGDYIIWNNNYSFPQPFLNDQNGFAYMKLRIFDKIIEVQKSDGLIVAKYSCP